MINKLLMSANKPIAGYMKLSLVTAVANGILQIVIPLYAISLQATATQVGLIRGLAQIGNLLATLPGGLMVDRYGARYIFLWGGLADMSVIWTMPLASKFQTLILLLFFEGMVVNMRWTALNAAFFDQLDSFGRDKASWIGAFWGIGFSLIGPLLAGPLIERTSYTVVFAIVGAIILGSNGYLGFHRQHLLSRQLALPLPDIKHQMKRYLHLLADKWFLRMAIIQCLARGIAAAFSIFIIVFMVNDLKVTPTTISLVVLTQGLGYILMMFWGGRTFDSRNLNRSYVGCFVLQGLGLVAAGLFNHLWCAWMGAFLMGMGTGWITAVSYSIVSSIEGEKGQIAGCYNFFAGSGMVLGPLLASLLSYLYGIEAAFLGFIPLIICLIFFTGFYKITAVEDNLSEEVVV